MSHPTLPASGRASALALALILSAVGLPAHSGPWDGTAFHGRIAWSADGNHNDEDDWGASPMALAIFAAFGVQERLVHFDYNNILTATNPAWEKEHETSVLGAVERFGFDRSRFYNCRRNLDAAIASLVRAVNESSPDNPLYLVLAGPMQAPYLALSKAERGKLRYVYCISHSRWNEGFARAYRFTHNKRDLIALGVHWVQIRDQNQFLRTSPWGRRARPEEWAPWHWLRDAQDDNLRFLWRRLRAVTRADCSDAGMAYFLMTGDEEARIAKVRSLLADHVLPAPSAPRARVRIEAENFAVLEGARLDQDDPTASHRLHVGFIAPAGRILTIFDEPYTAKRALYDVHVRFAATGDGCRFSLAVAGQGAGGWTGASGARWRVHAVERVTIADKDRIQVAVHCPEGGRARLDYVELHLRQRGDWEP